MDPDPTHPNILFAGLAQDGVSGASNSSIFESADYGATWQPVTGTGTGSVPVPASSDVLRVSLGVGISQDGTHLYLYALMADTLEGQLHNNCIYTSQDGGTTWSCTAQSWDSGESFWNYDSVIAVDPISATTAYAGGVDLWKTIDGGTSWTNVTNGYNLAGQGAFAGVHVDQHAIAFIPSTPGSNATPLYLGNDGGVWSATTAGQTTMAFTDLNDNGSGLDLTQFYAGSVGTTGTSSQLYGASQDNGVEQYPAGSISGAKTWNEVQGGDGWNVVVDPTNNANVYAENNGYINGEETAQVLRSTDGGSTWSTGFQVPLSEFAGLYPPLALSPNNASEVLLATDRLHKSTDGGTSWSSSGASQFQSPQGVEHATSLAVAPGDDNRTYVGTDTSHVWVSTDGGSTWNETQSQPVPPNSNALVTGLAVDPSNENTVYVTYSTYAKCQSSTDPCGQHVYRTTNGGSTWTDISWDGSSCTSLDAACLPNAPFEGVVLVSTPCGSSCQPTTDIIVASDVGVFESTDSGASWAQLGYGLPTTQIDQVFADASGTNIYVATHGRGMWRISTPFRVYSVTCNTGTGATNEVYALDASTTGTLDWVHSTTACTNKPAVLNSTVYVTVQNGGGVLALDGASGNLLWQYTSTLNFLSDPLAANGLVYVSGGDNYVYALNATTGTLAWKTCLCKGRLTGFAVATDIGGGAVYAVDSTNGYLYALNATTGAILWYYTNKATPGGAVYANGMLYFQSEISTKGTCPCTYYMNGANATTSNLVWSYLVAEPNAPAVANGVVYFLDQNAVFHALNATTGAQIWQVVIYYAVQSAAPTVYNGVVYLNGEQIGFDAQFQALQASNGSVIWTYYAPSNGGDLGHAVVANGIVFVNDSADGVRALNITNGSQYWVYPGSGAGLGNNPYLDAIAVGP